MPKPFIWGPPAESLKDGDLSVTEESTGAILYLGTDGGIEQSVIAPNDDGGNQVLITNWANRAADHGIAAQANPLLAVFSDAAGAGEYVGFKHDGTSGYVVTGTGALVLVPATGDVQAGDGTLASAGVTARSVADGAYFRLTTTLGSPARFGADGGVQQSVVNLSSSAGGYALVVGPYIAQDKNFDHGVQPNPTLYLHSATDPDSDNTEWLSAAHNQTDAVLASGKGKIVFLPAGSETQFGDGTGYATVTAYAAAGGDADFNVQTNIGGMARFGSGQNNPQTYLAVGGNSRHVLLLTTIANRQKSHGHAAQTNPTLFIHSAVDPSGAPGSTYWFSATHNQTDAILASGAGNIELNPASGKIKLTTLPGNFANDAAAAAGGVALNEVYRNGSILMIRVA